MHGQYGGPLSHQDVEHASLAQVGGRAHYGQGLADLKGTKQSSQQEEEAAAKRAAMVSEWDAQVEINRQKKEAAREAKRRQDIEELIQEAQSGSVVSGRALEGMGIPREHWDNHGSPGKSPEEGEAGSPKDSYIPAQTRPNPVHGRRQVNDVVDVTSTRQESMGEMLLAPDPGSQDRAIAEKRLSRLEESR